MYTATKLESDNLISSTEGTGKVMKTTQYDQVAERNMRLRRTLYEQIEIPTTNIRQPVNDLDELIKDAIILEDQKEQDNLLNEFDKIRMSLFHPMLPLGYLVEFAKKLIDSNNAPGNARKNLIARFESVTARLETALSPPGEMGVLQGTIKLPKNTIQGLLAVAVYASNNPDNFDTSREKLRYYLDRTTAFVNTTQSLPMNEEVVIVPLSDLKVFMETAMYLVKSPFDEMANEKLKFFATLLDPYVNN